MHGTGKTDWLKLWTRKLQKIGSFSRGLCRLAGVQDGHADQPLAAVMVYMPSSPITLSVACWGMAKLT
jgi:hypothetical protein